MFLLRRSLSEADTSVLGVIAGKQESQLSITASSRALGAYLNEALKSKIALIITVQESLHLFYLKNGEILPRNSA